MADYDRYDRGDYDRGDDRQRAMQRSGSRSMEQSNRGQYQTYGDPDWHVGRDMYGNPVWYRSYGWSWRSGEQGQQAEQEPHEHGRTESKHYQRSDDRIREDVYDRLNDHANVDSGDIKVTVKNGEVILDGTVHDRREKRMAEDIAESVSGVKDIQNNLKLSTHEHGKGAETTGQQGKTGEQAKTGETAKAGEHGKSSEHTAQPAGAPNGR